MEILQKPDTPTLVNQWYDAVNPVVSIVVLNWNKASLTVECLKSLFEHTQGERYEIIVVDNGSRAEEFAALSAFEGVHKILRLDVNRFFGEGNNLGAELAKGKFVMFMNNDVTVTPNWLHPLVDVFRTHPDCGVAGPKFVYPHGMLQEAGALLDEDGDAVQIGKFQDPALPRFNRMRVVDYVSAACVILRKADFDRVLGFDIIYEPAYYEDVDLCMKIGELGLKTLYVPGACIVHHENATTADPDSDLNLRGLVDINRGKFVHRWNKFLETARHAPVRFERARNPAAKHEERSSAAIFTSRRIDTGEPTQFLLSVLGALHQLGFNASLLTPEKVSAVRIAQIANLTGIAVPPIELGAIKDKQVSKPFDIFITMDERLEPPLGLANYCLEQSTPDAAGYQVVNLSPGARMLPYREYKGRTIIVSEGQFRHGSGSNRQDGLIRAFQVLTESGASAELHLAGSLLPESAHREFYFSCERLAEGLPVHFHIDSSREELDFLYGEAFIYWHAALPCQDNRPSEISGLSTLTAMSTGAIPLIAAESSLSFGVADELRFASEDELSRLTRQMMDQPEAVLARLRRDAQNTAQEFSQDRLPQALRTILKLANGDLEQDDMTRS